MEKNAVLKEIYKKEFDIYNSIQEVINQKETDPEKLIESLTRLNHEYFKQLKTNLKITRIGDSTQNKLIKAQMALEQREVERNRVLELLRENEEKLRAIFENAIAGIVMMDREGKHIFANSNFCDMLGYSIDEIYRLTNSEVTYKDDLKIWDEDFASLVTGQCNQFHCQKRLLRKDKSFFWVDFASSAIYDNKDRVVSIIGIAVDIDEQKKSDEKLKQSYIKLKAAQDEIIELEKKNSAFAMAVTANHEINQPLMILKGNLEMLEMMLEDLKDNDKAQKYLLRMDESIDRIQSILNKFKEIETMRFENYTENTKMIVFETDSD